MDDIIEKLKEFGFNSYEAKVYLALLKNIRQQGMKLRKLQIFHSQGLMIL